MSFFDRTNRHRFYFSINMMLMALFVISFLSSYVSPNTFWAFPFIAFLYPVLFLCMIFWMIFWGVKKRIFFLYNLVVVLLSFPTLYSTISIGKWQNVSLQNTHKQDQILSVMSWNVRLFDLYNWSNNQETKDKIFEVLSEQKPDIACFQEFFYDSRKSGENIFVTKPKIHQILEAPYSHEVYTDSIKKSYYFGTAIFSKYPIVGKGEIHFDKSPTNVCSYADIVLKQRDTVRVYNVHLASIRLSYSDYRFLDQIKNVSNDSVNIEQGSKNIFYRMKKAFLSRAEQVKLIKSHLQKSPYPIILCGDFNDPPFSYTYKQLTGQLKDAFVKGGVWLGATYANYIPALRIDYILYDPRISFYSFQVIKEKHSDHYPLMAKFVLHE